MGMGETDFDLLTQETFELSQRLDKDSLNPSPPQEGPGVVFYLDASSNTFCLRAMATENQQETLALLEGGHEPTLKALRIGKEGSQKHFWTFPTESVALAETLVDGMANRRHPLREDVLCNLSDPGQNWWMQFGEDYLRIFFQYASGSKESILCLGPMGDPLIAYQRLRQSKPFLGRYFVIDEFSVTEKVFFLQAQDSHSCAFAAFKEIFLSGQAELEEGALSPDLQGETFHLYFRELALKRRFWCEVEKIFHSP